MEDTLGFVDAAVVDSHRRDGALLRHSEIIEAMYRGLGLEELCNVRTQQRAEGMEVMDIVENCYKRERGRMY